MRSRIISAEVGVLGSGCGTGACVAAGDGDALGSCAAGDADGVAFEICTKGVGEGVCAPAAKNKADKTRKIEVLNLLTFNGILSPPTELNFFRKGQANYFRRLTFNDP
jgi:hypothetical protein